MNTDLQDKMDYKKHNLLKLVLGLRESPKRFSTLQLALERARYYCGNDKGQLEYSDIDFATRQKYVEKMKLGQFISPNVDIGDLFVATLLYLNGLEQLGNLFYSAEGTNNGISDVLMHAQNVGLVHFENENSINALKRLRHALAHNYGLVSVPPKHTKTKYYYKYILTFNHNTHKVIEMPKSEWECDYSNKSKRSSVIVHFYPLINMIENVFRNSQQEFLNGTIICAMDKDEIETNYTITIK